MVNGAQYTNDFVVEINATSDRVAEIASLVGMINIGPGQKINNLQNQNTLFK